MPRSRADLDRVYAMFPVLAEKRRDQLPAALSGGQQQMLAIGRALMARRNCCCSTSPRWAWRRCWSTRFSRIIADFKRRGLTVLLVEQNANAALAIADRGYVMETGRITMSGSGRVLLDDERVRTAYLGVKSCQPDGIRPTAGRRRNPRARPCGRTARAAHGRTPRGRASRNPPAPSR